MRCWWQDAWALMRKPAFTLPLIGAVLLGYVYGATHVAIGIDDLAYNYYLNAGNYIVVGRLFGWVVLYLLRLLGWSIQGAEWASMAVLSVSAVAWCVLLKRASGDRLRFFAYPCFGCLFVTYPLIHEIWQFSGMNVMITFNYLWTALALTVLLSFVDGKRAWWKIALAAFLMMMSVSQYESAAVVFITGTFMALLLRMLYGQKQARPVKKLVLEGLWFLAALALAVALEKVVTEGVLAAIGRQAQVFSSRQIAWTLDGAGATARVLFQRLITELGLLGLWYLPIGVLVCSVGLCLPVGAYLIRQKKAAALLPLGGLMLSLVLLPLMQGVFTGYRTCQQFAPFCAFMLVLSANLMADAVPNQRVPALRAALLAGLSLWQGIALTKRSMLDYARYAQEAADIRGMAAVLEAECDLTKPVLFFGQYRIRDDILEQCTVSTEDRLYKFFYNRLPWLPEEKRLADMDVESVIDWSAVALEQGGAFLVDVFHYLGYEDVQSGDLALYVRAREENGDMPAWPEEGSVRELEEYIAVRIGPQEETQ